MKRYSSIFLIVAVCGCASTRPGLTLAHHIEIPKLWSAGGGSASSADPDPAGRYADAYERGWWTMVRRFAQDINYDDPSPLVMGGWIEEAEGGQTGYVEARDRIEELIRVYGKPRVSKYLRQLKRPEEN
ncbi:MAG TPA: hypothetical protein VMB21_00360 [Candidatus Limnocylindria bacterium]|jgi:hypothetical protein|nr:hypothetical protein [Candidatus Limnocylindria bacterium]